MQRKGFKQRAKDLWNYFSTYEKIWFLSILVIAIAFTFIFPETDDGYFTVTFDKTAYATTEGSYDTLVFEGTTGEFTLKTVKINGETVKLPYAEFSIEEGVPDTLKVKLPMAVTKDDEIAFTECWQDSDEGEWHVALVNGESGAALFETTVDLTDGASSNLYTAEEKSDYIVPVVVITICYLLDVVLNISCELLISKQSKWNFIVSLGVEVVEILVCIFCAYRFATMATTLLFWIPCDIISFVMWNRHPDEQKEEVTIVKKLTPMQDVLIVLGIIVWTVGVGYLLTFIEVEGGIFATNSTLKNIACYLDACASAVGIANGLLILFRYREQWIAWYISAIIETVINIMAGQWILLVLKAGYLTNTTYGYIKWTQYIRQHNAAIANKQNVQTEATTEPAVAATNTSNKQ